MLRIAGFIALGIVVGFAAGGVPARRDAASLQSENRELREQLRARPGPSILNMLLGQGMADVDEAELRLGAGQAGSAPAAVTNGEPGAATDGDVYRAKQSGDVAVIGERAAAGSGAGGAAPTADDDPNLPPWEQPSAQRRRDRRQQMAQQLTKKRFSQMATAQRARAVASRAALISNADLSSEQVEALDKTIEDTNTKLAGYGEEVIEQVATGEDPEPAESFSLAHDVTGILGEAQQDIDQILEDSGGADSVPREAANILGLVDVDAMLPAADRLLPDTAPALPPGVAAPGSPLAPTPSAGAAGAAATTADAGTPR